MGLLENLAEGFGRAAGATGAVGDLENRKADRKASAHEQLQANTKMILDEVSDLHEKKAKLHPGTDDQTIKAIDKRLGELQGNFTDLYHPEKNPGALQHLGGFLKSHLGGKQQPVTTPAEAKAKFSWGGGPAGTELPPPQDQEKMKPVMDAYKKTFGVDMPAEKQQAFFSNLYGGAPLEPKPQHVSDYAQGLKRFVEAEGGDPDNPTAEQEKAYRESRSAAGKAPSKFSQEAAVYEKQWGKKIADWSPEELSYFNQKLSYDAARNGQSTTTRLEKDEYGNIHPVEITNSRGPTKPPVDPHAAPSIPTTPGQAKHRMASAGGSGSRIKVGDALPFKGSTPAINKAQTDVNEATKLSSIADQVSQHPDDAVNQKRLAVALERASAGRFTTQALDYIIKAGWGNTLEQWANNPSTGALPADVLRQLVDGAHQNLNAAQTALTTARGGDSGAPATTTAQRSGKAVSLAAAKQLPQNRGKSDDAIRKDIEAHGHTVTP